MFGSGVILATSLVHMFCPADQTLSNPCLPNFFTTIYSSMAGAIALFAILSVQLLQFVVTQKLRNNIKRSNSKVDINYSNPSLETQNEETDNHEHCHDDGHTHGLELFSKEQHISTLILELGIASHSIIIGESLFLPLFISLGVTLGVATSEFRSLLVALVFHQFFEGMALSTVVMETSYKQKAMAIGMVLFYSLTTPLGIANKAIAPAIEE